MPRVARATPMVAASRFSSAYLCSSAASALNRPRRSLPAPRAHKTEKAMSEIVLGIGSSHGPLLSTPPEQWDLRAKADRANKSHWFRGKTYDYESLLQARAPGFADEIVVEKRRERFMQCRSALEQLGKKFDAVSPDAVVILGNDQREFFNPGLTPSITVYRGAQISNVQHL